MPAPGGGVAGWVFPERGWHRARSRSRSCEGLRRKSGPRSVPGQEGFLELRPQQRSHGTGRAEGGQPNSNPEGQGSRKFRALLSPQREVTSPVEVSTRKHVSHPLSVDGHRCPRPHSTAPPPPFWPPSTVLQPPPLLPPLSDPLVPRVCVSSPSVLHSISVSCLTDEIMAPFEITWQN